MLLTTALVAAVLTAISNQLVAAEIPKVGILYLGPKGTALSVDDIDAALKEWEADQLALGRHLDRSGRALGNALSFHNPKRAILSPHGLSSRQKICLAKYEARAF
jgi:hypothetical protein